MTKLKCTTSAVNGPIWTPPAERAAAASMTAFMADVSARYGVIASDYSSLHRWSIESPHEFWPAVAEFTGMVFDAFADTVLVNRDGMPGAHWFVGGRLNFAANLLKFCDDRPAVIFRDENGSRSELSYADLHAAVAATAAGLRESGVTTGDRVAGFLPNHPQAIIAMLATTSIGAIWSSCSPDFGVEAVLDRFGQIAPKVLFTADGYIYDGKRCDSITTVAELARRLDGLECVVVVPFLDAAPNVSGIDGAVLLKNFVVPGHELVFESLPFDHPVYIMYSSGTTGAPKCIVHGAGGTLIQHLKEHVLHTDLKRDDRFFFFTTCGWMMWNWLVSGLASGATIVLYDGSPFQPDAGALWRMAEEEGITIFGAGAKYFLSVEKSGFVPAENGEFDSLRTIMSTGSPLAPSSYEFVYTSVKEDIQLASISGGTDLLACFALGNPLGPVYTGELQCVGLGMAVEILDDDGEVLSVGEKGELTCTQPFPSMPVGFWNDPDGNRYREAYFERFPGIWAHGDYAERTVHGGLIIYGRSDAVLNAGGVRIGTAEIYREVEKLPEIVESIAIGQRWKGDTRIVLFVVLREHIELSEALRDTIRNAIRFNASPRHIPEKIIAVAEIPRTRSGKIVELAVRSVVHGEPVENEDALANPEALDYFCNLPELDS
jgi:acetoacetyl-CoA synthetase